MTTTKTRTRATTCSRCGTSIPGMTAERCPDCGGPALEPIPAKLTAQAKIAMAADAGMTYNSKSGTLEMICPDCGDSFCPATIHDVIHIDCAAHDGDIPLAPTTAPEPVKTGAHAHCSHPSTKAARATCRRARAK